MSNLGEQPDEVSYLKDNVAILVAENKDLKQQVERLKSTVESQKEVIGHLTDELDTWRGETLIVENERIRQESIASLAILAHTLADTLKKRDYWEAHYADLADDHEELIKRVDYWKAHHEELENKYHDIIRKMESVLELAAKVES